MDTLSPPKPTNNHPPLIPRTILSSITYRQTLLTLLPLLSAFGFYTTMFLASRNGTFPIIVTLLKNPNALFPYTDSPMIRTFTGIAPIDRQLSVLVAFFAPMVADRGAARDVLGLFKIFGLGQFAGAWTIMMLESLRAGNEGRILTYVGTFGVIFQNISYTVTTPIWLLIHLLTSPVAKTTISSTRRVWIARARIALSVPRSSDLCILPVSIMLSYWVPSLMMGLPSPSVLSANAHQYWIAIWQAFPVYTVVIQYLLRSVANHKRDSPPLNRYLKKLKWVYILITSTCTLTHLPVLLLALLPVSRETVSSIYIPYLPVLSHQVSSLAEGVHMFLLWDVYIGSLAFVLWAVLLYRDAMVEQEGVSWQALIGKVLGWSLVSGPIGCTAMLLWERDETVMKRKEK